MPDLFSQGASYVAGSIATEGTFAYAAAYVAVYALEVYALERITASLGASKPRGAGRGLEVSITDTGAGGFAIYGLVRVSGTSAIPE